MWNDTDYWQNRWGSYDDFFANVASHPDLGTDFFSDEINIYLGSDEYQSWQEQLPSFEPPLPFDTGDYWALSGTTPFPFPFFVGAKIIKDDWGTWYINVHEASMPGVSFMRGEIFINENSIPTNAVPLADFPTELQPDLAEAALQGTSGGVSGGYYLVGAAVSVASGSDAHVFLEGGLYRPGGSAEFGYTFVLPWTR